MRLRWLAALAGVLPAGASGVEVAGHRTLAEVAPGMAAWRTEVRGAESVVVVTGVSFLDRDVRLRVVPQGAPPQRLARIAAEAGALAACNGSYFHADGTPLGLVVSNGKVLHPFERAKLLSGLLVVRGRRVDLLRAPTFSMDDAVREAVQAGPWLVEDGAPVRGLEATRRARRTVAATDGRGRWAFAALSGVTLAEAAIVLTTPGVVPGWAVRAALNLDGGGSTALWTAGGAVSISESDFVSNVLLVMPAE